jgi:uncharacterized protein YlaN (UPF0358 family)
VSRPKKKITIGEFTPIPEETKKEWNALVAQGIKIVARQDSTQFDLVLLFGKVETAYGQETIKRFSDEIGLSYKTGYTYRKLFQMGVDQEFIAEWKEVGFSVIREILFFCGRASLDQTQYFLNYAKEHRMSVRAIQAYMMDTSARNNAREVAEVEIKQILQSKQDMEGFSDIIKFELERLAESHPELTDEITDTQFLSTEDVVNLKMKAGILTDDEVSMVETSKRLVEKLKQFKRHFSERKPDYVANIAYGHEHSDDIRFHLEGLRNALDELVSTPPRPVPHIVSEDILSTLEAPTLDS